MSGISASIRTGFAALRVNPLRTTLSALGVIIGVGAMVSVLSLSDGVEESVRTQLAKDGRLQSISVTAVTDDVIDGQKIPRANVVSFTPADARALAAALTGTGSVFMSVAGPGIAADPASGRKRGALISGTLSNGAERVGAAMDAGRFFSDDEVEGGARVAAITRQLADSLFGFQAPSAQIVGRSITLQDSSFQIIGVWKDAPDPSGRTTQLRAYVPITVAKYAIAAGRAGGSGGFTVRASTIEAMPEMQSKTEAWLATRYGDWKNRMTISSYAEESARVRDNMMIFKILMSAITGVSLVVGGVGIMNVLLASVTERTREIGVRKATGARNKDLLAQFLAESVAIAGMGSVLGTLLGVGVASAVAAVMRAKTMAQVHAGFSLGTLLVAVSAPIIVGIAFGIYPALRAARLSPIDAIRHE